MKSRGGDALWGGLPCRQLPENADFVNVKEEKDKRKGERERERLVVKDLFGRRFRDIYLIDTEGRVCLLNQSEEVYKGLSQAIVLEPYIVW